MGKEYNGKRVQWEKRTMGKTYNGERVQWEKIQWGKSAMGKEYNRKGVHEKTEYMRQRVQ